ncbi:hypothetical protein [Burkholderia contaminans]|uniref:hypothetical protein n=1 Tax=Burkholderia contaminans TaxID=488447 RepID=UPI001CF2CC4D|nr:hypothetical protein [Burkholderia contaminans]MCA8100984.1 hypothetical protein [Burkholderia contaminans]
MGVMVGGRIVGRESSMLSHGAALQHAAGDVFLIQRYDESRNQCGYVGLVIMPDQNMKEEDEDFKSIRRNKQALISAIEKGRSDRWILRLWSRFIKVRDSYRCVCCNSKERIQSHHIVRKTLYPSGRLSLVMVLRSAMNATGEFTNNSMAVQISCCLLVLNKEMIRMSGLSCSDCCSMMLVSVVWTRTSFITWGIIC